MKRALLTLVVLALAGCAAASGYDPKRYANQDAGAPDPETAPLPPSPKTTVADPKQPAIAVADAATPTPAAPATN